ncbi:hypothetical protein Lepto7376_4508 [[Leptolyngbya] sp. PCC 7376]|uniref:hypothetical protein n=1 Tax=[Leptolyngbya] sp. PCC 7376 TaxID=111781 RepID=UPI00029F42C8|nr:hypothetical protein [[Leptolyngbya] sp. PCC 7376]AFY40610.1 hypothetical protein Lepto7376_4508 [[Leptolyngbya] sp. PCC 7376]
MGKFWNIGRSPWLSMALGGLSALSMAPVAFAQTENLPTCTGPNADEFLVLVFTPSEPLQEEVRLQVGRTLSQNHDLLVCQHGGNVLSRIGNFESQAKATEWAEYFDGAVGLPLMVITPVTSATNATAQAPEIPTLSEAAATPPDVIVPTETAIPSDTFRQQINPSRNIPIGTLSAEVAEVPEIVDPFEPKALNGSGYGVLVDYGTNPAIATDLKTLLSNDVALVSHATRGYLLAEQTADEDRLVELLNLLSQNNFAAIAVPVEQIIILKPNLIP